jgi:hypothetical protein
LSSFRLVLGLLLRFCDTPGQAAKKRLGRIGARIIELVLPEPDRFLLIAGPGGAPE